MVSADRLDEGIHYDDTDEAIKLGIRLSLRTEPDTDGHTDSSVRRNELSNSSTSFRGFLDRPKPAPSCGSHPEVEMLSRMANSAGAHEHPSTAAL